LLGYFSLSLFASAALLFLVQPMIGKMILPQLGGTPAVWNTCMVFFQGVLLVGYGYTHLLTTTQSTRRQVLIQGCMLFLPFLVLPFALGNWEPETEHNPIFSLLGKLCIMVGLPFFLVSTTAPLLQKWFFHTGHPAAKDPYFLYGASNFGSMLGLVLYPTVVEPWLQVSAPEGDATWQTQVHLWTFGYALFVGLVIGCAVVVWQALAGKSESPAEIAAQSAPPPTEPAPAPATVPAATAITSGLKRRGARSGTAAAASAPAAPPAQTVGLNTPNDNITFWRRLRWIGLAAAASSLMLGVTTYMTTDIAAVAFFWIIPLGLYLLTFILVFSRWPTVWTGTPHMVVMFVQPCLLLFLVLKMIGNMTAPRYDEILNFTLHLGAFFSTALMCHGELAKDRPSAKHLTEFYFWMSLGGVLGGLFNALFSPIVFQYGIWEYPAAMAFACLLRSNLVEDVKTLIPGDSSAGRPTRVGYGLDFCVPIAMGLACYGLSYVGDVYATNFSLFRKSYLLAVLVVVALALSLRPVRFGLSVAALFIAMIAYERVHDPLLYEGRSFFGFMRVREQKGTWEAMPELFKGHDVPAEWKVYRKLIHGGIDHGQQVVRYKYEDANGVVTEETEAMNLRKRREPITYFHERNGIAELFYKLTWPKAQPVTAVIDMNGRSDARLPASMFALAGGDFAAYTMLANTQSEPPFAVVGLGTGLLACYAKPYQHVDIYEIDPLIKNLSIVPGYVPPWHQDRATMPKLPDPTFYFVHDAQERYAKIDVKLGDGRLQLKKAPEHYYHIIVLDAFSSDAIPVHLLTKDAIKLYLDKLADGGVLIFNTTNRYMRIEGVLAAIAGDLGLVCLECSDIARGSDHPDRFAADWLVLQRKIDKNSYKNGGPPIRDRLEAARVRLAWNGRPVHQDNGDEVIDKRWHDVEPLPGPVWTDSYSNLLNPRVMPWLTPWRN
jgi:hypothetical protein